MPKPAYVFANIKVPDLETYIEAYAMPFLDIIGQFNGEVLAATAEARTLEGQTDKNWTVLLRFPSQEDAETFYYSEQYAPLLALRQSTLSESAFMTMFEGQI